ncbi:uncharacterized protein DUF2502 [Serratia fonticola]|uniref:Uncharacterized protein DUF2502 n=1 Tax=Serratia fonticola TaxID=47917 RepID=A0A559T8J4_SERFO|nr:DUF2502 domain-containing protein [Serratia fonticola]TQI81538.1 uncharacterized protein DUF2502 [Serratia fonticola]TQI96438.1 uncharacterized protein DUF2502 [Serratia fonticola]TVZ70935.1 uncharacterized protein DUF2502 [Serratia fonticola]
MFKSLFVAAILAALIVPITQPAHANGLDIDLMPGVSLRIGDKDDRGNYWDGYDWRDRDWWYRHQGRDLGERSRRGYYWDGYRWRDRDYWQKNYYYHDGRYRKFDKHYYKYYNKQHHKKKHHHEHHHHDHDD